jgi:HK97 gp10 family phage protein
MIRGATGIQIKVEKNKLPELAQFVTKEMRQAVHDATEQAAEIARSLAPVDTGALVGSITTSFSGNQYVSTGEIIVGVDYGIYVEFGTMYMAAQPFLTPAVDQVSKEYARRVDLALQKAIKECPEENS